LKKGNIVLLTTPSRESHSKRRQFAAAARELGLEVRNSPDARTEAVIPCSDYRAVDAAVLCQQHGVPGSNPMAARIATHKSLAYRFLESRGLRTLGWQAPLTDADLLAGMRRPVIVKPDLGSGSFSRYPWGYRVFASARALRDWLRRNGLLQGFLDYQQSPRADVGRFLLMEYVPSPVYGVACLIGDRGVAVYDRHTMKMMPDSMVVERILFGERHADERFARQVALAFAALGMRRSIFYVQCVARHGRLYAIDFNLRPGTLFDLAVAGAGVRFHTPALAYLLGREPAERVRFSRYFGVRRMNAPLQPGRREVTFGTGAIPLMSELHYDPSRPYDAGHALPVFAVRCSGWRDFDRRAEAVIAGTVVNRVRQAGRR